MYITFLGILAGVLARTMVPYLVKLKKNPKLKWNNKYLVSSVSGFLLSVIISYIILLQIGLELNFGTSFLLGFTLQSLSRDVQKLFGN